MIFFSFLKCSYFKYLHNYLHNALDLVSGTLQNKDIDPCGRGVQKAHYIQSYLCSTSSFTKPLRPTLQPKTIPEIVKILGSKMFILTSAPYSSALSDWSTFTLLSSQSKLFLPIKLIYLFQGKYTKFHCSGVGLFSDLHSTSSTPQYVVVFSTIPAIISTTPQLFCTMACHIRLKRYIICFNLLI